MPIIDTRAGSHGGGGGGASTDGLGNPSGAGGDGVDGYAVFITS